MLRSPKCIEQLTENGKKCLEQLKEQVKLQFKTLNVDDGIPVFFDQVTKPFAEKIMQNNFNAKIDNHSGNRSGCVRHGVNCDPNDPFDIVLKPKCPHQPLAIATIS